MADHPAPLASVTPYTADRLESRAVRRIEFLADKMPQSVQLGMKVFPPSEMAMRAWARIIAAADDPGGIEERLVDGTGTPEDREVMQALYPDRMAEIMRRLVEDPERFRKLPYRSRLALSFLTGAAVDPSMDPRILAQLQRRYTEEPNTEGGTQAPRPQPAFGSVSRPEGTPAQQRAAGA